MRFRYLAILIATIALMIAIIGGVFILIFPQLSRTQIMLGPQYEFEPRTFTITNKTTEIYQSRMGDLLERTEMEYVFVSPDNLTYLVTNETYQKYNIGQSYYYDASVTQNVPIYPLTNWVWAPSAFGVATSTIFVIVIVFIGVYLFLRYRTHGCGAELEYNQVFSFCGN
jgi:hypothetical protein